MFAEKKSVSIIDLLVGTYLLWGLINNIVLFSDDMDCFLLLKWLVLCAVYIVARVVKNKMWIVWSIVFVGVLQALWSIGQQGEWIRSNHRLFEITGFMGNPGQLGGFQAVAFVSGIVLAAKYRSSNRRLFVLASLLLIGYSLWLADSRASWVAVVVGVVVLFRSKIRHLLKPRPWLLASIIAGMVIFIILIFNYRSDSARARLLVWRVSADMVMEKPILGYGTGGFNQHYMLYQARYFEQNPDSEFIPVADNAAYPYNEFLHLQIEHGLIGLILFLAIIAASCVFAKDKILTTPFLTLLIFSCFSYPSYKFGLLILFPLLLGCIDSKQLYVVPWVCSFIFYLIVLGSIVTLAMKEYPLHRKIEANSDILNSCYDECAANFIDENFHKLYRIPRFNMTYLFWMTKYPEMRDTEKFKHMIPTCESWCDVGDFYTEQEDYSQAIIYYRTASYMVPTRLLPNYRVWKLYLKQGCTAAARQVAKHILSQPLKMETTFTLRAKGEIRRFYCDEFENWDFIN